MRGPAQDTVYRVPDPPTSATARPKSTERSAAGTSGFALAETEHRDSIHPALSGLGSALGTAAPRFVLRLDRELERLILAESLRPT